ncbi:MAG: SPOR domain-containing protein [Lautropia sp.]|nr:SPOR domain-containing protein [Lautropia sp.]
MSNDQVRYGDPMREEISMERVRLPQGAAMFGEAPACSLGLIGQRRRQQGGTLLGLVLGLLIGTGAAAGVAWYIYRSPLPFITPVVQDGNPMGLKPAPAVPEPRAVGAQPGAQLPDPNQGASRQQVMPQPDPRTTTVQSQSVSTVDVTQDGDAQNPQLAEQPAQPAMVGGGYLLQAGSFRRMADAERLKGNLALRGLEARVESGNVNGQTVYRVRIGPYPSLQDTDQVRADLADEGIEAAVVRGR